MPNNDYIVQSDPNFINEAFVSGLNQPINLTSLPDGKILLLERPGVIKIIDPQASKPVASKYLQLSNVNKQGQRGLISIALDPNFETNKYFYVYYTRDTSSNNNGRFRISRFKHLGNSARASDETVIWEANENIFGDRHYGGALGFGPDGYLYLATGENSDNPSSAQDLTHSRGKVIRLDPSKVESGGPWKRGRDNSHLIPDDNPFVDGPGGNLDEIWATGLRNPFTGNWDLPSGRFFVADVGGDVQATAEEEINAFTVNDAGANFGWPNVEGISNDPTDKDPLFAYAHTEVTPNGGAVIAGPVYRGNQFPSEFKGAYFFADYAQGWIRYLKFDAANKVIDADPSTSKIDAYNFDKSIGGLVSLKQGADGALYYTDFFSGQLRRIRYDGDDNLAPVITKAEANRTLGVAPFAVDFTGSATDPEDDVLKYVWDFGDGTTGTGRMLRHTYQSNGLYKATLEVSDPTNKTTSNAIDVVVGSAPEATITSSSTNGLFRAGDTINFVGSATDDGPLTENNYQWDVRFIHNAHFHPEVDSYVGSKLPFKIETTGHDFSDTTGFEVSLTVTDSEGLTDTETVSIFPDKVDLNFGTNLPGGVTYVLDGLARNGPFVHDTVINFEHTIAAPQTVTEGGVLYTFDRWSNGVTTATQTITVPDQDEDFKALYVPSGRAPRVEEGLQVLYTFDAGSGNKVFDISGTGNPLNLTIQDPNDVTWGNGILTVDDPALISSLVPARKVTNAVRASNELTVEAWIQSADINQNGPARIVTLSQNGGNRNFTLGQGDYLSPTGDFSNVRLRTTNTDNNGRPAVLGEGFSTDLTHVVYTREADGDANIYHDGVLVNSERVGGNLSNWKADYQLALANEVTGGRGWLGAFDLVAIYDQALSATEVLQNYNADADDDGTGDDGGPDEPANNVPSAVPDSVPAWQDMPLVITSAALLNNDDLGDTPSTLTVVDINSEKGGTIVKNDTDNSYTYTPAPGFFGTDTFSYLITDADGDRATATVTLTVAEAHNHDDHDHDDPGSNPDAANAIGEVGHIDGLGLTPQTITLQQSYDKPVVIVKPASNREGDPIAVRLYNAGGNKFTVALQEPSNLKDNSHLGESLTYMVLEAGTWELEDGTKLEAGLFTQNDLVSQNKWKTIDFDNDFTAAPVVLSQVQSKNDTDFVRTRQRKTSAQGVQIGMEEQESRKKSGHPTETIAYVAIEESAGSWNGIAYESNQTGNKVTHKWHTQNFANNLASPEILASISTYDGADPSGIRYQKLTSGAVQLRVEEDTSADREISHTTENVDYLAFGGTGLLTGTAANDADDGHHDGPDTNPDDGHHDGPDTNPDDGPDTNPDTNPDDGPDTNPDDGLSTMGITGKIQALTHNTQTINFGDVDGDGNIDFNFVNPVVIANMASLKGADAAVPRIFNVTGNSFDIEIQETDFLPINVGGGGKRNSGEHAGEAVQYLVVEAGTWRLDDGSQFTAGTLNTNQMAESGFSQVNFNTSFVDAPAVISQTQTKNDGSFVAIREQGITRDGFGVALQEEERNKNSGHLSEKVGYIAFDPVAQGGKGRWSGHNYAAGRTGKLFDHKFDAKNTLDVGAVFDQAPSLFAQIESFNDPDAATLRYKGLGASEVQLKVVEDKTLNTEGKHGLESVSYLAIEGNGILSATYVGA